MWVRRNRTINRSTATTNYEVSQMKNKKSQQDKDQSLEEQFDEPAQPVEEVWEEPNREEETREAEAQKQQLQQRKSS